MTYNISFDIAAVIILLLVLIATFTNYVLKNRALGLYRALIICLIMSCGWDILTSFTIDMKANVNPILNSILTTLYYVSSVIPLLVFIFYIMQTVKSKSKPIFIVSYAVIAAYLILLGINFFTGILFSFDKVSGEYIHGPLFSINYLFPLAYVVGIFIVTVKKRKGLTSKQHISIGVFVVLFSVCALIQAFLLPNVLLIFFGAAVAVASMLFSLETPDYRELEYLRKNLEMEVANKTNEINELSLQTIESLAATLDAKDEYTKGHSSRVAKYSKLIAIEYGLSEKEVEELFNVALLHDIGKIAVPDTILNKPGKLTDEEFNIVKKHTVKGAKILSNMNAFKTASDVARHHHERFDGRGYPDGLSGTDIPLFSRIIAVADSFDAMSSSRVYRPRLDEEIIKSEFIKNSGTQFDPDIVKIFLKLWDEGKIYDSIDVK